MPNKPQIQVQYEEAESYLKGSSWLRYNGILLTDLLTESYEVQEIRTQEGSQKLANHHVLKIMAIFNPQYNAFHVSPGGTLPRQAIDPSLMAGNIIAVRDGLMQERGLLQFAVAGTIVLESPLVTSRLPFASLPCDSFQGPKPLYCQVTQITGTSYFCVRFAIETWTDGCTAKEGRVIQAHRYSMAHDVDGDSWLTTIMVSGHVKFRPELLADRGQGPDQILSPLLFHPVPNGFKRSHVKVQAIPNGMELAYSFVDTEQVLPLGSLSPATKLTAEFSIGSSLAENKPALTQVAVHVAAVGPKNQYRFNLLRMALSIAIKKLQKPGLIMATDIMVTYSLDNVMIDLSMKAIWKSVGIGPQGLQLNDAGLTAVDDVNDLDDALLPFRKVADAEPPQGSQPASALSPEMPLNGRKGTYLGYCVGSSLITGCYLHSQPQHYKVPVNTDGNPVQTTENDDQGPVPVYPRKDGGGLVPFVVQNVAVLSINVAATGLSAAYVNAVGWYEDWQMQTSYRTNHQKAVMPVGAAQSSSPGDVMAYRAPQVGTLGLPYTLKVVDWSIAWVGPDPYSIILPSPETGDPNDVLLAEDLTPVTPNICNSTNKSWRISGTYWYLSKKLRTSALTIKSQFDYVDDGFAIGKSITDPSARADNTIGLTRFDPAQALLLLPRPTRVARKLTSTKLFLPAVLICWSTRHWTCPPCSRCTFTVTWH